MFRRKIIAAASVMSLLALPVLTTVPAEAVAAVPTVPTEITIEVDSPLTYGDQVSIEAQVSYTDPEDGQEYGLGGAAVMLERRYLDSSTWTQVAAGATSGFWPVFEFGQKALKGAEYRLTYAGDETYQPSQARAVVTVYRKVGARGVEPRTDVFYLKGKVQPTYAGKPVSLMRKKCASCSWKQIATQRTTKLSKYSFRLPNPRSGTHYFRVKVPAGGGFLKSVSDTWEIWRIL